MSRTGSYLFYRSWLPSLRALAAWGPGVLVMLADTDVGNIVTAAQGGVEWGYRLLPLVLLLIPLLYLVQELTVRLGIFTGMGFAELVRHRYGRVWAWVLVAGLGIATTGSLVTEFTGFAGVGEIYGVPRAVALLFCALTLLAVVFSGAYRRVERVALVIGMFELAFFAVAWVSHPNLDEVAAHVVDLPLGNHQFLYLSAALIGSAFNPWMVFYQQSAVVDKGLDASNYVAAKWDTAFGAVLTQLLTAAILIAAAATLGQSHSQEALGSVGGISEALSPILGPQTARLVFSLGVLGAAMVAAIVSSLAMAWGVGEVLGLRRRLESEAAQAPWFIGIYVACVVTSVLLVWAVPDLVWLNIATQVANAFMLPFMMGTLLLLANHVLPAAHRVRGAYLWVFLLLAIGTSAIGLWGGVAGLL